MKLRQFACFGPLRAAAWTRLRALTKDASITDTKSRSTRALDVVHNVTTLQPWARAYVLGRVPDTEHWTTKQARRGQTQRATGRPDDDRKESLLDRSSCGISSAIRSRGREAYVTGHSRSRWGAWRFRPEYLEKRFNRRSRRTKLPLAGSDIVKRAVADASLLRRDKSSARKKSISVRSYMLADRGHDPSYDTGALGYSRNFLSFIASMWRDTAESCDYCLDDAVAAIDDTAERPT